MINNRQGGRRRGRGGQRGQTQGGQPGNRQDNRQRGNAAQLLEKYKSMARDSQLAGDRVQTEYFLQYADHYFRVLGESRSRFEDQRPQRGGDDMDEDEGDNELVEADGADAQDDRPQRQDDRPTRQPRRDHARRSERDDQPRHRAEQVDEDREIDRDERPVRRKRSNGVGETLPLSALPPAIGRGDEDRGDGPDEAPSDEPAKPRRRARPARSNDDDDGVVPAA